MLVDHIDLDRFLHHHASHAVVDRDESVYECEYKFKSTVATLFSLSLLNYSTKYVHTHDLVDIQC